MNFVILHALGDWHDGFDHPMAARILCIIFTYSSVCFIDIRRRRPSLEPIDFVVHFMVAFAQTVLLMPLIAIAFGCIFLVVLSFCQLIHVSTDWLNWPIYYGVLYGPWSFVYVLVKRRCIHQRKRRDGLLEH